MASRRPLVIVSGLTSELPPGDGVVGASAGTLVAGSGLEGGGALTGGTVTVGVALAATPSGLIFVGDALGLDGAAQASADTALASGNAALVDASTALSSGNAALETAAVAQASGNAALSELQNKYAIAGGPITGVVTTESRAIGRPDAVGLASGTITLDFSASNNFDFTLVSSGFLANPVLPSGGQSGAIVIRQRLQGSGILSYGTSWKFAGGTKPTLTATSSGVDIFSYYCVSPSVIAAVAVTDLK